jgi:exosortase/archaeosortase family protein
MVGILQKKEVMKEVLIFLLKFNLFLIPFYAIIYFELSVHPLQTSFTNLIASILRSMNYPVKTREYYLFIGNDEFPIEISMDCLGWKSIYSLFALLFATSARTKDRLKFLAIWIPVLLLVNILRVLITLLVGLNFGIQYLEFIHTFLWQQVMVVAIVIIFYIWLRKGKIK